MPQRSRKRVKVKSRSVPQNATDTASSVSKGASEEPRTFLKRNGIEVCLVLAAMVHAFFVSLMLAPSYDEGKHIINGVAYLENNTCCLSDESPFCAAHALFLDAERLKLPPLDRPLSPSKGVLLYSDNPDSADWIRVTSRISSVLMLGLIAVTMCLWLRRFASRHSARAGLFLVGFCPTLLAYASVAGADIHLAAFALLSLYKWVCFTDRPTPKQAAVLGAVLGITFLTKFSALLFGAVFAILFIMFAIARVVRTAQPRARELKRVLLLGGLIAASALFVLNLGYFFEGTFSALDAYTFDSESMRRLQEGPLGSLPLPFPEGLFKSIDFSRQIAESDLRREVIPGILFGTPYPDGSPWFYLALLALKPSAILLGLLLFGVVYRIRFKRNFHEGAALFVYPIFLVGYLSAFDVFNRGIRYLLPLFPLFIVAASYSFMWKRARYLWAALALFAVSTLCNFPNYLAFFNVSEYFAEKETMLVDSNLDWGQLDHLVVEDAREHGATRICPRLAKPHPKRLGLPLGSGITPQPCTFYLSKTVKMFPKIEPMFRLFRKPPDRVLGGLIEVYEAKRETDFVNEFVNRWMISEPFRPIDGDLKQIRSLFSRLRFSRVQTKFGKINVGRALGVDRLRDKCVLLRSETPVRGTLLLSSTGRMSIFDEKVERVLLKTKPLKRLVFYQNDLEWGAPRPVSAMLCGVQDRLSFVAGYLEEMPR